MPFLPVILVILLDVYAIFCLWREKASVQRTSFWLAAILLLPGLGSLVYLFFFRRPPPAAE